jgi:hypothetical protein
MKINYNVMLWQKKNIFVTAAILKNRCKKVFFKSTRNKISSALATMLPPQAFHSQLYCLQVRRKRPRGQLGLQQRVHVKKSRCQYYKTFYGRNLRIFTLS